MLELRSQSPAVYLRSTDVVLAGICCYELARYLVEYRRQRTKAVVETKAMP
jgi:hypothetical protein